MDYKITYEYKGTKNTILTCDNQNILGAIHLFYEEHAKGCRIIKIKEY